VLGKHLRQHRDSNVCSMHTRLMEAQPALYWVAARIDGCV
jgi:hypothetical protein